jgi:hypothetical protein
LRGNPVARLVGVLQRFKEIVMLFLSRQQLEARHKLRDAGISANVRLAYAPALQGYR